MVSFAVREKVLISHPIPDRPIPNSDPFGEYLHAPFASRVVDFSTRTRATRVRDARPRRSIPQRSEKATSTPR